MERNVVENSSQIASVGFDHADNVLEVEFKNGSVYHYTGVPPDMADAFVRSPSLGRFLHEHIKGQFPHFNGPYRAAI